MKQTLGLVAFLMCALIGCSAYKSGSASVPNSNVAVTQSAPSNDSPEQPQQPCPLTVAGAPEIKGLRLRMTADEVLALFPGSKADKEVTGRLAEPPSQFGVSQFVIRPDKFESKDKFADTTQITFNLLDGRVSSINFGYNGPQYSNVDQFVTKFVQGTSLPPADQWQPFVGMDNQLKTLSCQDFEVRVFSGGEGGNLNYVLMRDLEADKKLKARRAKASAEASPTP